MDYGVATLEIFVNSNHPERVSESETKGLRHVAFTVKDLDQITEILECEDIRTDWFGNRFTFTKDPDGQLIELKESVIEPADSHSSYAKKYKKQTGKEVSFF